MVVLAFSIYGLGLGLVWAINVMELLAQHPNILLKGIKWSLDLSAFSHIYSAFGHIVVEGLKMSLRYEILCYYYISIGGSQFKTVDTIHFLLVFFPEGFKSLFTWFRVRVRRLGKTKSLLLTEILHMNCYLYSVLDVSLEG